MRSTVLWCLTCVVLVASAPWGWTAEFKGKVTLVTDGDTLKVLKRGDEVHLRIAGIDCPEKKQAFGRTAREFTADLATGKVVIVREVTRDWCDLTVAEVILPDGRNLGHVIVEAGLAWWSRENAPNDHALELLEADVRITGRGLWADPRPIPPWEWRNRTTDVDDGPVVGVLHGNTRDMLFHKPGCRHYNCKNCTAVFMIRDEAIRSGYKPCKVCSP